MLNLPSIFINFETHEFCGAIFIFVFQWKTIYLYLDISILFRTYEILRVHFFQIFHLKTKMEVARHLVTLGVLSQSYLTLSVFNTCIVLTEIQFQPFIKYTFSYTNDRYLFYMYFT